MGPRFVNLDRGPPLLLPPNLRDWVPADPLAHFVVDAVEALDLRPVKVNLRGTGDEQYPPSLMRARPIYSCATGTFGSRRIGPSTSDHVAVRPITADTHPEHDTICTFRRENRPRSSESFVKVLPMAQTVKGLKFGQITVSADGTRVLANASKPAAELAEHEKKMAERPARKDRGQRVGGKAPAPPSPEPKPSEQYNFTEPASRIVKAGRGEHFEPAYHAPAAAPPRGRGETGGAELKRAAAGPLDSRWGRLHPRASGELREHARLERRTR